jgi:putative PIN family toxin of toxin-antitoxin system
VIPRIVVDTNVPISGTIAGSGYPRRVTTAWRTGDALLLMSDHQRAEIADVIARPKIVMAFRLTTETCDDLLGAIDDLAVGVAPEPSPLEVRDVSDEPILALALTGKAGHLITGDRDLLVLDGDPRIGALRIVTPRSFCEDVLGDQAST